MPGPTLSSQMVANLDVLSINDVTDFWTRSSLVTKDSTP